ncbi:hypothetical protein ACP70R_030655 [Stipagrostis hirtigluma subsp. patula]
MVFPSVQNRRDKEAFNYKKIILMCNKGAFSRFRAPELKPDIAAFSAVPHPNVKPMTYVNNFLHLFQYQQRMRLLANFGMLEPVPAKLI